jgi:hypothetical protein
VPIRTKADSSTERSRKRVMSPIEITPINGQKISSKIKKTFRLAMRRLRWANA